ncbi:MAG: OmpA/MotB domain protein [Rhizobacter sp.]|nr:OmpA/MotB domain protein [Rhizobacter sp.]
MKPFMHSAFLSVRTVAAAALLGLALVGCASVPAPPAYNSYVVLLDNDDGSTGKVQVTGAAGTTVLDQSHEATFVGSPAGQTFMVANDKLSQDFAPAIAATPMPPVSFLIYFDFGTTRLTAESRAAMPKIVAEVVKRPAPDISVIGHTDTVGDDTFNEALGLSRAKLVADLLVSGGKISPTHMALESHGKRNLLVATPDKTEEPRNRRVEVTVR